MKDTISEPLGERGDDGAPGARVEDRGRSGVALILVIGMLALMVVLGVTFSIYMRTERVAAGSFKSSVVARQLISVALNRALDAINSDLGNKPYPTWNVLESLGITLIPDVTNINSMAWIPRAALGSNQTPTPRWIDVPGVDGRVGYLVVNCSGLLDANISGSNGVTRSIGTNVNEIQISVCPDVANVAPLVAGRPYETIQELGVTGLVSGALNQPVSNFVCYSYFPAGYPGGTNISFVDLSGDENALMGRHANIVNGFIACGFTNKGQAEFIFTNLLDYVDADCIPRDLGSACTESVPMFNEVQVKGECWFNATGTFEIKKGRVSIEWFYPFVGPSPINTYKIECTVNFQATPAAFPVPANVNTFIDAGFGPNMTFSCPSVNFALPSFDCRAFTGQVVTLTAKVNLKMHESRDAGQVVDAVPYPAPTFDLNLPITIPLIPITVTNTVVVDAECVDPRFNWDVSPGAKQWSVKNGYFGTLGLMNSNTLTVLTRDTEGHSDMYVADRPLVSATELTYLLRGQTFSSPDERWNTIRLFDWLSPNGNSHSLDRVLDYFIVGATNATGFVNPNSRMADVLTAVFEGMPMNRYPGEPAATVRLPLNHADAVNVASFWVNTNLNLSYGNFTRLSDIGHATNVFAYLPGSLTPFQQESFFRYTTGLFNPRQQYFKILLFAQTAKTVPLLPDKSVLADVRAIAEVWRDPLPNAEGIHPCVVRMVHLLNND